MLFDRLLSARMTEPSNPEKGAHNRFIFFGKPTAGIQVSAETALCIAAVYECVKIISETLGMLPWRTFERADGRKLLKEGLTDFTLHCRPNPEMPAMVFRMTLQAHALLWGNCYAEIERNRRDQIIALWPITPNRVTPKRDETGELFYEIHGEDTGKITEVSPRKVFHVRGLSWGGHEGYNLVNLARETFSTALATEQYTAAFFGNGAVPAGLIEVPPELKMSETGVENMLKSFEDRHRGVKKAHRPGYLDKGMTYKDIGISPENAQLIESKKFNVLDVARWFRMPPHKLAHLDDSIKANIEAQGIEFVTDTMLPWVMLWEQEGDFKFFPASDRGRRFTKMNLKALMRGDSEQRGTFYKTMASIGALSINEVREEEDMDPVEGGDLRLVPMNMVSIDQANQSGQTGLTRTRSTDSKFKALFVSILNRCLVKEHKALAGAIKKYRTHPPFAKWADTFYATHGQQMLEALEPAAAALLEAIGDYAIPDFDRLLHSFVRKHCKSQLERASRAFEDGTVAEQWTALELAKELIELIAMKVTRSEARDAH